MVRGCDAIYDCVEDCGCDVRYPPVIKTLTTMKNSEHMQEERMKAESAPDPVVVVELSESSLQTQTTTGKQPSTSIPNVQSGCSRRPDRVLFN